MVADWDTQLHSNAEGYPTHRSRDKQPRDHSVVIMQVIGSPDRVQAMRVGDTLYRWEMGKDHYEPGDEMVCKAWQDYVWRGCGGFDF